MGPLLRSVADRRLPGLFSRPGGASGTVAKSISAYDKTFSDYLYNNKKSGRYVSENRLEKMLSIEYNDLIKYTSTQSRTQKQGFLYLQIR
jgi:hypothetical protein